MGEKKINGKSENNNEELVNDISKIIKDGFDKIGKKQIDDFLTGLNSADSEIEKRVYESEEENLNLKYENFKNKLALVTFNGVILALMVGSANKINYGIYVFILLFISFAIGIIQMIIFYFINEYKYLKGTIFAEKVRKIIAFCRENRKDEDVVFDTKSFIRGLILSKKEKFGNIHELINDFDKKNSPNRAFLKILLFELLFYIPFILGFGLIIFKVFEFLTRR